jgi:hypothetical protein
VEGRGQGPLENGSIELATVHDRKQSAVARSVPSLVTRFPCKRLPRHAGLAAAPTQKLPTVTWHGFMHGRINARLSRRSHGESLVCSTQKPEGYISRVNAAAFLEERLKLSAIPPKAAAYAGIEAMTVEQARAKGYELPGYPKDGFIVRYYSEEGKLLAMWRWRNSRGKPKGRDAGCTSLALKG